MVEFTFRNSHNLSLIFVYKHTGALNYIFKQKMHTLRPYFLYNECLMYRFSLS